MQSDRDGAPGGHEHEHGFWTNLCCAGGGAAPAGARSLHLFNILERETVGVAFSRDRWSILHLQWVCPWMRQPKVQICWGFQHSGRMQLHLCRVPVEILALPNWRLECLFCKEKSVLPPRTITNVEFLIFNYEIG